MKNGDEGLPGGTVDKKWPASAVDVGLLSGPGGNGSSL